MARIRTIKPEFPQSESVGRLSRDARLLFVQIWTIADDYGRARAASRFLAGQLYPYDDDAPKLIGKWLAELVQGGFIRLYESEGSQYLDIPAWGRHQRIDNAGKSTIPEYNGEPPRVAASGGEPPLDLGPRKGEDLGPRTIIRAVAVATRTIESQFFEEFWKAYPKRLGANPKTPARKKFEAAVKSGVDPGAIIAAAERYAVAEAAINHVGTQFVATAVVWLTQQRWEDYSATAPPAEGVISWDEQQRQLAAMRAENDRPPAGTAVSGHGFGAREANGVGREKPATAPDNQSEHAGVG